MKILQVTNHFLHHYDTLWPVEQEIDRPLFAAVPDILADSPKVIFDQKDLLPWFESNNTIQLYTQNIRLDMIALISNTIEETIALAEEYESFINSGRKRTRTVDRNTVENLNKLYNENL